MKSNGVIHKPDTYDFIREMMSCDTGAVAVARSHHEAYALIKEHLDRYWQEILLRDNAIHKHTMLQELASIAAVCCRACVDLELM